MGSSWTTRLAQLLYMSVAAGAPPTVSIDLSMGALVDDQSKHYVVDLDYQLNQGQLLNNSLVTFRNVRYAAAPLGDLRFRAPAAPPINRSTVQNHPDVIPPQAFPSWLITGTTSPVGPRDIPPVDPRTSEDCLFLDVLMPKSIWQNRQRIADANVLVWIPGGGFDVGWKDASGTGLGLVSRSTENGKEGVILVSINYRLGLFGWMYGQDVTANAGLLDQAFALQWVQQYISRFGGDPNKVTILGESAGGGSILAHITAYGGDKRPSPFKGAITQSAYYPPRGASPNASVDAVLAYGKVSSVLALRNESTQQLQQLNALIVGNAYPFGNFIFGIVKDNHYVPDLPTRLIRQGRYDNTLVVMTGHNQDEGSRFVPNSQVTDETQYEDFLKATFPPLAQKVAQLKTITQQLYPPVFDGSYGYISQTERNNLTIADAWFVCPARALDAAPFSSPTYAYEYTVPPAVHGADLTYTFYDFGPVAGLNQTVAVDLQQYLTNFAQGGDPNGPGVPAFAPFQGGKSVQTVGTQGFGPMPDEGGIKQLDARCKFWQEAPYLTDGAHSVS